MKKFFSILSILLLSASAAFAYEVDANSVFARTEFVGLRPYSRYTLNCPSIVENVNYGDRANLRFFFMDNEPFEPGKRAGNVLVIRTFDPSSSSFEVFMQDGNSMVVNYKIDNKYEKNGAVAGNCRIEP